MWTDRRIAEGTAWNPEIEAAMRQARVAILLVTANLIEKALADLARRVADLLRGG